MKTNLKRFLLLMVPLWIAPFAPAQQLLHNFSAFLSPQTLFFGDWALTEPGGDPVPIATFSQGAGFYNFSGGSNADTASVQYSYATNPGDLTGYSLLEISARMLAGNAAQTFTVTLFDSNFESAYVVFATADFNGLGFTTVTGELIASPGFDPADLASFKISGDVFGGTDVLNFAADNLAVVTAVPEPSTYGAMAAVLTLAGVVGLRRFRRFR
jgi:hypothetical protein